MLPTTVRLHDIDDVEGFVCATIEKAGLGAVAAHEKEELVGDGILILYRLAEQFEPHRPGYSQPGRFSGFAAQFLPRRLGDAWHSRNPSHVRVAGPDGKRRWVYLDTPISLDSYLETIDEHSGLEGRRLNAEAHIRPVSQQAAQPIPA